MKQLIRPLLGLLVLFMCVNRTEAQTARNTGQFSYTFAGTSHTVNYSLSPAPPLTNDLYVTLNSTPDSLFFSMDVANAAGSVLMHWQPATNDNTYMHGFDISALPAGNYTVRINDNSSLVYTISFTK